MRSNLSCVLLFAAFGSCVGVDSRRVASYADKMRTAAPALREWAAEVRANSAAGVPRSVTALENLMAAEQVLPEILLAVPVAK